MKRTARRESSVRSQVAAWAWKHLVRPSIVGVVGRRGPDMYMYRAEDLELVFYG